MLDKISQCISSMDSKMVIYYWIQLNNVIMSSYLVCRLLQEVTIMLIILLLLACISTLYIFWTNRFADANPYAICICSYLLLLIQVETMQLECFQELILTLLYYNKIFQMYRSKMTKKPISIGIMYCGSIIYVVIRQKNNFSTLEAIISLMMAMLSSSYLLLEYFNQKTSILSILNDTLNHNNQQSKEIPKFQSSHHCHIDEIQDLKTHQGNSIKVHEYAAFDLFPNAIIILDKDSNQDFQINYLNKMIQQVFDTTDKIQILSNMLNLQDEHNSNQSELSNIGLCSMASYQSALRPSISCTKFKNILQIPSKTNEQLIDIQKQNHLKETFDHTQDRAQLKRFSSINQLNKISYQIQPYKQMRASTLVELANVKDQSISQLPYCQDSQCIIHLCLVNYKCQDLASGDRLVDSSFGTILEQLWTQAQQCNSLKELQPLALEYINESSVFVSKIDIKGKMIFLDLKAYAALDKGKIIMIIIIRDVSYRDYIKTLQSYSRQKSQTLSFVSHELRTPLNCSISMLDTILENTSVQHKTDIELIKSAKVNMKYCLNIAQDLLDLAQMKSGKFQLNITSFNLNDLLQDCFQMFKIQSKKQGIALNLTYQCEQTIQSDEQRIRQVIINLVNNALKFTIKGSITIKCLKEENGCIYVEVIDTGIGVKKEDQPKLLKAFGKIQDNETKQLNSKGVGLGLIISNQICQQLSIINQGLGFISEYGKGSTFYFRFKNHSTAESSSDYQDIVELENDKPVEYKINILNSAWISTQSINRSILIVDDNQFNIDALKTLLLKLLTTEDQIDSTISGYLAEEMCTELLNSKRHYSIIFMDIEMPFQDGTTTSKKIRQIYSDHNQQVLIIGCSAYNSYEIQGIQEMDDYVVKPVSKTRLQELLAKYYFN